MWKDKLADKFWWTGKTKSEGCIHIQSCVQITPVVLRTSHSKLVGLYPQKG